MADDHEDLRRVRAHTMQLDALPEELLEGTFGDDQGYTLADDDAAGPGVSAPPPLPPGGSQAPPGYSVPAPAEKSSQKKTVILAVVVGLLMAGAGILVGMFVLGEDEPAESPEPPPSIELGDIEVQSH